MKKLLRISLGILFLAGLIMAATYPAEPIHEVKTAGLKVGDTAPDFKLKDVSGDMIALADYKKAKGFIVTFTCNTCPFAVMYEDRLIDLHNNYADKGYHVVAINPNDPEVKAGDSYKAMQIRASEKKFPFRYLFDDGQQVYPQYGASKTPHIYLLDKDLKVRYIGSLDDSPQDAEAVSAKYVEDAITAIEKGEEPSPSFTKAIGCTIKVKK